MTFLVIDSTRHWLSISSLFLKQVKQKGHQCPDYTYFFFLLLSKTILVPPSEISEGIYCMSLCLKQVKLKRRQCPDYTYFFILLLYKTILVPPSEISGSIYCMFLCLCQFFCPSVYLFQFDLSPFLRNLIVMSHLLPS